MSSTPEFHYPPFFATPVAGAEGFLYIGPLDCIIQKIDGRNVVIGVRNPADRCTIAVPSEENKKLLSHYTELSFK